MMGMHITAMNRCIRGFLIFRTIRESFRAMEGAAPESPIIRAKRALNIKMRK